MGFLITHTGGGSLTYKDAVRTASSANVPLTGSAPIIVGGVSLSDKDRVLLKDQGNATQNGIYTIAISGGTYTLTRSPDCNTSKEMVPNMLVPVSEGTFADRYFQLTTNAPIVLGTTALAFDFASVVDHGTLLGLGDDDHTQYHNDSRAKTWFDTDYLKQTVTNGNTATVPSEDAVFDHVTSATSNLANRSLSNLTSPTALNQVLLGQNGTVAAPAYSFTSSTNSGIYYDPSYVNPGAGGLGSVNITRNGVLQLRVGTGITIVPNVFQCYQLTATYATWQESFGINNFTTNVVSQNSDMFSPSPNQTTSTSWGRDRDRGDNFQFRRPYGLDVSRRLRVGKKINDFSHYGAALSVTLPDTFAPGTTQNTSSGTTIHFSKASQPQVGFQAGVGDTLEITGLGEARIVSIAPTSDPMVITLDSDLGGAAVANKTTTLKYDLASFRLANGTEKVRIDYDGNTNISGELRVSANTSLNAGLTIKSRHAQTGTVTVLTSDIYIGCNSSGGAVTVNLPAASSAGAGKKLIIKDEGGAATTNNISIVGNGGDLIDGSGTQSLVVNYESVTLVCNGAGGWFII